MDDSNWFEWEATIRGPPDTPWDGGVFNVELTFPLDYDLRPPQVHFSTVPFHPNIDMTTGRPCVDFLDDPLYWKHYQCDAGRLLLALQTMLHNPVLENPVNPSAAHTLNTSPHLYEQLVRDCVIASQRIQAGLRPHPEDEDNDGDGDGAGARTPGEENGSRSSSVAESRRSRSSMRADDAGGKGGGSQSRAGSVASDKLPPIASASGAVQSGKGGGGEAAPSRQPSTAAHPKVSFGDYYTLWRGVATSRPSEGAESQLASFLRNNPLMARVHGTLSKEQLAELLGHHRTVQYGKFDSPKVRLVSGPPTPSLSPSARAIVCC